jgi:hypothetical protein
MASWLDERFRAVLDEKLREWIPQTSAPPNAAPEERPEYLSREAAAQLTGYSTKTIMRWIRAGRLRPYGLRGERVKRGELERLMGALPSPEGGEESATEIARRILDGDGPRGAR